MIDELLTLAEELARREQSVAKRRAISTAYYAAFHALCELVADAFISDRKSKMYERIYRHIEHSAVNNPDLFRISDNQSENFGNVRDLLLNLRQSREIADYSPRSNDAPLDAEFAVAEARNIVEIIRSIQSEDRYNLALNILLGGGRKTKSTHNSITPQTAGKNTSLVKPRRSKSP